MIKILYISFLLFICGINFSSAQKRGMELIDSVKVLLPAMKDDTTKVNALIDISFEYYLNEKSEKGIEYSQMALNLANKLNWKKGMADANDVLGANYLSAGKYELSDSSFTMALNLFKELGIKNKVATVTINIGNLFIAQGKEVRGLENYFQGLKVAEELNDTDLISWCDNLIGTIYMTFKDYTNAIKYKELSYNLIKNSPDMVSKIGTITGLAVAYQRSDKFDLALQYNEKAIQMGKETGYRTNEANLCGNAALIHTKLKNYLLALQYGYESLRLCQAKDNDVEGTAWAKYEIGNALLFYSSDEKYKALEKVPSLPEVDIPAGRNERLKLAIKFLNEASVAGPKLLDKTMLLKVYEDLMIANRELKNYQEALNAADSLLLVQNSVFSVDKSMQLNSIEFQNLMESKSLRDSLASQEIRNKAELSLQKQRNYTLLGGLIAAAFIIFSIFIFRKNKLINIEKTKSEKLLLNILPAEVAEELKLSGKAEAQHIAEVTVIFTDFKGFTQLTEKLSAAELIKEINFCFEAFDNIITKHGIEKIKTIGDSYMAAGGLPTPNKTHAIDVVNAALEIQKFMFELAESKRIKNDLFFEIRIGVHTGPVVAGIVGVKKFQYDIWGDTVNIASRMESSGEVGKVNISQSTYEKVKDEFNCVHRGKIQAKGKGEIDMYFVVSRNL